jgi:hypothetical protein
MKFIYKFPYLILGGIMAANITKSSTTRHRSALWLFSFFVCVILIFFCRPHNIQAQNVPKENKPSAIPETMTEKTNLNIGKTFPEVKDNSLEKTLVSIPDAARGKVTLIVISFLHQNQSQLDSWLEPFVDKFGNKESYTFYEVPMISGGYKFMRPMIDGGMRAGIPKAKHKNVVTMYGDVEKYIKALSLDPKYGYAFLLDREGIIRFQGQGFSTPETLKELFKTAERLAK